VKALREERFDTALLFTNSLRTAWLAWMSGASRRIGFARELRSWLLTDRVIPRSRQVPNPVIDEYRRLAEQLGCSKSLRRIELSVLEKDQADLEQFWRSHTANTADQGSTSGYVCLNTGGAFGKAKNWPRDSFAELARRIAIEFDKSVLVVCGPAEREDARWIAAEADHSNVHSLAETPVSIGLTKAAIRGADLLVTTDSGPRHFAAAFDTPVITMFGPTHIAWSETYYDRAEHMQVKVECGPCQKRECPLGHHRCMKELSVDMVFSAVRRQLDYRIVRRHVA
jgi:heptosyltransferase-2